MTLQSRNNLAEPLPCMPDQPVVELCCVNPCVGYLRILGLGYCGAGYGHLRPELRCLASVCKAGCSGSSSNDGMAAMLSMEHSHPIHLLLLNSFVRFNISAPVQSCKKNV